MSVKRAGTWIAALLIVGAALFAIGTAIERGRDNHAAAGETGASESEAGHSEADEHAVTGGEGVEASKVLGLDVEATPFVVLGVVASLALAAVAWRSPRSSVFLGVAGFALFFAVLDVAEVSHHVSDDSTGLAVLAGGVAALHLSASAVAATSVRRGD
jgi:hypothetical protein